MSNSLPSTPITRLAAFTDIHFGKRNNSHIHNQDCLDFLDFFCEQVEKDGNISHIAFLGDWFENRSAINISTLEYSYQGLQKLNALGIPIFFIVGNHDLHRRTTRDVHSVNIFNEFDNIIVVDEPIVYDDCLFCPFMFEDEYPGLVQYDNLDYWFGHFEFKGFRLTGYNRLMEHGPDHAAFAGPKRIFSGHFHCRQENKNTTYIGNTFPMDFSDSLDDERGMMILDRESDEYHFIDWEQCPSYNKPMLSQLIAKQVLLRDKMRLQVTKDVDLSYSEVQVLRESLIENHGLRELTLINMESEVLDEDEDGEELDMTSMSTEDVVVESIATMEATTSMKPDKLVKIFTNIRPK